MKAFGLITGRITEAPKIYDPGTDGGRGGGKSYIGIYLDSPNRGSNYKTRVKARWYMRDLNDGMAMIKAGDIVTIGGELSAESAVSKTSGRPYGILAMNIRTLEVVGGPGWEGSVAPARGNTSSAPAHSPPRPPAANSADGGCDDIPF